MNVVMIIIAAVFIGTISALTPKEPPYGALSVKGSKLIGSDGNNTAGRIPIAGTFDPDLLIGINVWSPLKLVYSGELPCGLSLQSSVLGPMVCGKGFVNTQTPIHDIKTVLVLTSLEYIGSIETAPEAPADSPMSPEKRLLLRSSRPLRDQSSRRPAKQVGMNFKADFALEYLTRPAAQFHSRTVSNPPWKTEEEPGLKRTEVDPEDRRPTYPSSPG